MVNSVAFLSHEGSPVVTIVFSIPSHVMTIEWFRGTPYDFGTSPCEILDLYGSKLPWYPDEHQCSSSNSYAPWSNGAWGFHGFWSSQKWNWKSLYWLYLAMIIPCLTIWPSPWMCHPTLGPGGPFAADFTQTICRPGPCFAHLPSRSLVHQDSASLLPSRCHGDSFNFLCHC